MSLPIPEFPDLSIRERSQRPYISSRVPRTAGRIFWYRPGSSEPAPDDEVTVEGIRRGEFVAYRERGSEDDISLVRPTHAVHYISDHFTHPNQVQWYDWETLWRSLEIDPEHRDPYTRVRLGDRDLTRLRPVLERTERPLPSSVIDQGSSVGARGERTVSDPDGNGRRVRRRIGPIESVEEEVYEDPRTEDEIRRANRDYEENFQEVLQRAVAQRGHQRAVPPTIIRPLPDWALQRTQPPAFRGDNIEAGLRHLITTSINRYTLNLGGGYTYNLDALASLVNGVVPSEPFVVIEGVDNLEPEMPRSALEACLKRPVIAERRRYKSQQTK